MSIHKILAFILVLWLFQALLSYRQISDYRNTLKSLKDKGKVYIGQKKGKLTSGSITFIVVNDDIIVDFREMKGITVFDKFKKNDLYIGKPVKDLVDELSAIKKKNVSTRAILSALNDYA